MREGGGERIGKGTSIWHCYCQCGFKLVIGERRKGEGDRVFKLLVTCIFLFWPAMSYMLGSASLLITFVMRHLHSFQLALY